MCPVINSNDERDQMTEKKLGALRQAKIERIQQLRKAYVGMIKDAQSPQEKAQLSAALYLKQMREDKLRGVQ